MIGPKDLGMDADAPTDAANLLADLLAFLVRYVAFPSKHEPVGIAVWVMLTYVFERFEQCGYLSITSPEKRSGKTTLLELLELVVARPWRITSPSEAVFFRRIERDGPTILLDEVDCIFGANQGDKHEGLRAALNAGNRAGTKVSRCVGKNMELKDFSVFCPKVLAGIGALPDTVADRSIQIRLRRRAATEKVARFRRKLVEPDAAPLRERLAAWAQSFVADGLTVEAPVLEEINDRAADNWEPLLVIADGARGGWLQKAEAAARALEGVYEDTSSLGVRLLADLQAVWFNEEFIATATLCERLKALEESPWADLNKARGLTARGLADLLKPFDVRPRPGPKGEVRGYYRSHLADPWGRYVVVPQNGGQTVKASETVANALAVASATDGLEGQPVNPSETSGNGYASLTGPDGEASVTERRETPCGPRIDGLTVYPPFPGTSNQPGARAALEAAGVRVWVGADGDLRTDPPPVALDETEWALLAQAQAEHRAEAGVPTDA